MLYRIGGAARSLYAAVFRVRRVDPPHAAPGRGRYRHDCYEATVPMSVMPAPWAERRPADGEHAARAFFSSPVFQLECAALRAAGAAEGVLDERGFAAFRFERGAEFGRWGGGGAAMAVVERGEGDVLAHWFTFPGSETRETILLSARRGAASCFVSADFILEREAKELPLALRATMLVHRAYARLLAGSMAVRLDDMAAAAARPAR